MDIKKGELVKSVSGHDRGEFYLVVKADGDTALLCDGKIRKLENPKKKSYKHFVKMGYASEMDFESCNDAQIRREIKRLRAYIPTTLLLIRHGQSESNLRDELTGQDDAPLTELGRLQAESSAKFVAENFDVDKVYSSDLKRAKHTGDALSKLLGYTTKTSKNLRELYAGKWEAQPIVEVQRDYPEEYSVLLNDIGNLSCPDGESVKELSDRVFKQIKVIASENIGRVVAVATHGTPIRVLWALIKFGSVEAAKDVPWAANASVTKITYLNEEWKIEEVELDEHSKSIATRLPDNI